MLCGARRQSQTKLGALFRIAMAFVSKTFCMAVLIRKPDKKHNLNAVAVHPLDRETVGYSKQADSRMTKEHMDIGERYSAVLPNGLSLDIH